MLYVTNSDVGPTASEETVLNLLRFKCLPIFLHATDRPLLARDQSSLEFNAIQEYL